MGFISDDLAYILAGISVGGQYALIAIGYTMVYGVLRLINFAHGDVFMFAGLMMVYMPTAMPLWLSVLLVLVLTRVPRSRHRDRGIHASPHRSRTSINDKRDRGLLLAAKLRSLL